MKLLVLQKNFLISLTLFLLVFINLAAFWNVQFNDFINLDDNPYILENPYVKKGLTTKSIEWAFTEVHAGHWHPVTWLSHMLDVELFGLNPGKHHLVNLAFHVLNTLLLFSVLYILTGGILESAFVAAFFAVHPLRVESVAWAAERKDVLCGLFFFLTIYVYTHYFVKKSKSSYFLVLLCFILALMSKPMAVTLPFVLLLLDYWPLERYRGEQFNFTKKIFNLVLEKIPLFGFTIAMSVLTYINHVKSGGVTPLEKLPFFVRIENASISYIQYLYKTFLPDSLVVLYPHPISLPFWKFFGSTILLIFITIAVLHFRKERPFLLAGWFWFLGTLVPVIGIVQAGSQAMADRFTYIPQIGIHIMVVFGISAITKGRPNTKFIFISLGIIILYVLSHLTIIQVERWRDSITLFTHTLKVTSNNYLIHNNLGATLMRQGKFQEAEIHLRKAIEIKPNYADAYHNLGTIFYLQNNLEAALNQLSYALKLSPNKAESYNTIGGVLEKLGKLEEAVLHFMKAVQIKKDYAEAHYNLGTTYLRLGKIHEALEHLSLSAKIDTDNPKTHHNLGLAFQNLGRFEEATKHFKMSISIRPESPDSHFCLANLLIKQGKREEAMHHLIETLKLNPNDSEAQQLLFQIRRDY